MMPATMSKPARTSRMSASVVLSAVATAGTAGGAVGLVVGAPGWGVGVAVPALGAGASVAGTWVGGDVTGGCVAVPGLADGFFVGFGVTAGDPLKRASVVSGPMIAI